MPKRPISLTIEETNLLWLKGRARVTAGGSVSEAVDQLVAEARAGRLGRTEPSRSVVGTIDLADDPLLAEADMAIRATFAASIARPVGTSRPHPPATKRGTRRRPARG